eukprot:755020-Prymnesium_polylepis.2
MANAHGPCAHELHGTMRPPTHTASAKSRPRFGRRTSALPTLRRESFRQPMPIWNAGIVKCRQSARRTLRVQLSLDSPDLGS